MRWDAIAGDPAARMTRTGMSLGTPGYMSPEQSTADRELDARSDVYALGSVCYEMLAGEPPFTGPTAQAVIARRLTQPAPSLQTTRPGLAPELDAAIRRALAPAPADRFSTMSDFSHALAGATRTSSARPARFTTPWMIGAAAATLLLGVAGYHFGTRPSVAAVATPSRTNGIRLAVLPFRLIGRDSGDQYLADGISAEVNSTLSNLGELRVIAHASVSAAAAKGRTMREIGAAIDADALVTGDVERAGTAVRVRVKLIDPATEETRWSQEFDHTTSDVFKIQSEVAGKVASLLRIQLAERESRSLGRPLTTNPEAYDLYLRARAHSGKPLRARYDSAVTELTHAIDLDSTFASAWALRAEKSLNSAFYFDADVGRMEQAQGDIDRALRLDSTTVLAWLARSNLAWSAARGWQFPEALADVRRAIALRPSDVSAHEELGSLYLHYGFVEEAGRELQTSLSLNPRDGCDAPAHCIGFSRPRVARALWYRQRFDSAIALYRAIPFIGGYVMEYAIVLNAIGRPAEGLALLDSTHVSDGFGNSDMEATRALIHAALGNKTEALTHIANAIARQTSRSHFHHAQFIIACAYARLGMKAEAVEWLKKTSENGMPNYPLFRNDPNMRSMQGDLAYEALMARLKQQFEAYGRLVRATSIQS